MNLLNWTRIGLLGTLLGCLPVVLLAAGIFGRHPAGRVQLPATVNQDNAGKTPTGLLREGSTFKDQGGQFKNIGGRITYRHSDGQASMVVLENLALERIAELIAKPPHPRPRWSVEGEVTEYHNANYLRVRRASLLSQAEETPSN